MNHFAKLESFALGQTVITREALKTLHPEDVARCLRRHAAHDWGEINKEDWALNDSALRSGGRLLSVYRDRSRTCFWIITEADRSATTVLLPSDY